MSTLSYCLIENTQGDFEVILDNLQNAENPQSYYDNLSASEREALNQLIDSAITLNELTKDIELI